ncbi:MAG: hypothetical protein ABJA79_02240 [Parafilimonas sp.]
MILSIFISCVSANTSSTKSVIETEQSAGKINSSSTKKDSAIDGTGVIKNLFESAADGSVIHIKPGTYTLDSLITIDDKSFTVYAYGVTIKMKQQGGYNAIRFRQISVANGDYKGKIVWYGGTFDGNRFYQNTPVANRDKENKLENPQLIWDAEGNTGLLSAQRFQSVIIKDVTIKDNAGEGVVAFNCKDVTFKNCVGKNGLPISQNNPKNPLNTGGHGHQWAYFKARSEFDCHALWDSVYTDGGSIGIHYSSNHAGKNSVAEINNCVIKNPLQDAVHIEHCKNVIINNLQATGDLVADTILYRPKIHVGNECETVHIKGLFLKNYELDFNQGSHLQKCVVEDFHILSEVAGTKNLITNAITVKNGTIEGKFNIALRSVNNIINVKFTGKGNKTGKAFSGSVYVQGCSFSNLAGVGDIEGLGKFTENDITDCGYGIGVKGGNFLEVTDNKFRNIDKTPISQQKGVITLLIKGNTFNNIAMKAAGDEENCMLAGSVKAGISAAHVIIKDNVFEKNNSGAKTNIICSRNSNIETIWIHDNTGIGNYSTTASSDANKYLTKSQEHTAQLNFMPGKIFMNSQITDTVTVAGVIPGQFSQASFSLKLRGCAISSYVSAPNTVIVIIRNNTDSEIALKQGKLEVKVY